jgi:YggT family protein
MGGSYLGNAGVFLIDVLFGFYLTIVLLRILLQLVRANFFNPICQFIVKITNPVLTPARRVIPNWGRLDLSALLFAWILKIAHLLLVWAITGVGAGLLKATALAPVMLLDAVVQIFLVVILIKVVLSWVAPYGDSPIHPLLYQLSAPIVEPMRRAIPPLGGLDFSPMVALIGLQLTRMLLVQPLFDIVARL